MSTCHSVLELTLPEVLDCVALRLLPWAGFFSPAAGKSSYCRSHLAKAQVTPPHSLWPGVNDPTPEAVGPEQDADLGARSPGSSLDPTPLAV